LKQCPLYLRKQTSLRAICMSALCQERKNGTAAIELGHHPQALTNWSAVIRAARTNWLEGDISYLIPLAEPHRSPPCLRIVCGVFKHVESKACDERYIFGG
jgi:hypothetical protein